MSNALSDADHDKRIELEGDFYLSHRNSGDPNKPSRIIFSPEQQRLIYHTHMETVDTLEVHDRLLPIMGRNQSGVTRPKVRALVRRIMNECRSPQSRPKNQDHWNSVKTAPKEWPDNIRVQARDSLLKYVRHPDEPNRDQFDIRCSAMDDLGKTKYFIWFNRNQQAFICNAILQENLTWEATALALTNWHSHHFSIPLEACSISRVYRFIALQFQESDPRSAEAHHWRSFLHRDEHLIAAIRHHLPTDVEVQRMPQLALIQSTGPSPFSPGDTTGQTLQPSQKRRAAHTLDSESSGSRASSSSLEPKKEKALNDMNLRHEKEGQEEFNAALERGGREALKEMEPPHDEKSRKIFDAEVEQRRRGAAAGAVIEMVPRQVDEMKKESNKWDKDIEDQRLRRLERERHGKEKQGKERRAQKPSSQGGQHGNQSNAPQRTAQSGTSGFLSQNSAREGWQYDDRGIEITGREDAQRRQEEIEGIDRESAALMGGPPPTNTPRRKEEVPQNRPQDKKGSSGRKKRSGN